MKLLRCGNKGSEKPAALDKKGKIRDLSSSIRDFDPENLNFETLTRLQKIKLESFSPQWSAARKWATRVMTGGRRWRSRGASTATSTSAL